MTSPTDGKLIVGCPHDQLECLKWATFNAPSRQFFFFATLHNQQLIGEAISVKAGDFRASYPDGMPDSTWDDLIKAFSTAKQVTIAVDSQRQL